MDRNTDNAEWARLVYNNQINGIEIVKRRQWAVPNYILLMHAAIIGFARLYFGCPPEKGVFVAFFLMTAAYFINILGIFHIFDMQRVLAEYRKKALNLVQPNYYEFVAQIDFIKPEEVKFNKYIHMALFFILLMIGGWLLVMFYLNGIVKAEFNQYCYVAVILILSQFIFAYFFYQYQKDKFSSFEKDLERATIRNR